MKNITILINGHPNSGKSTLRNKLQDKLSKFDFYIYDYDKNFQDVANSLNVKNRENFRQARLKNISGLVKASKKVNVISDVLLKTKEVFQLCREIRDDYTEVIAIRLFCNQNIREQRDKERKKKNPDAPHGFNNSMNPIPSIVTYDLDLDTSTKTAKAICDEIVSYLKSKGLL